MCQNSEPPTTPLVISLQFGQYGNMYLVRNNELVQVHHHQILDCLHVPVEAVVQGGKQALRPDLLLGDHVQLPGQEIHYT